MSHKLISDSNAFSNAHEYLALAKRKNGKISNKSIILQLKNSDLCNILNTDPYWNGTCKYSVQRGTVNKHTSAVIPQQLSILSINSKGISEYQWLEV